MSYRNECPACSKKLTVKELNTDYGNVNGVHECKGCGAIFSHCPIYLGESYKLVLPHWAAGDVPHERTRYYDFITIGSKGIGRRHGWFDTVTKRIVQTG